MDLLAKVIAKKPKTDDKKPRLRAVDPEFLPYVCHYDSKTILTKNGELMQIIRVTGFNNSSVISEIISLREAVRHAITANVTDNKFAFWFNTIRRKKNILPKNTPDSFKDFFSKKIDEIWIEENHWDDQYVNELYISVIIEGVDTSLANFESLMRSFSYFTTKSLHRNALEESYQQLSDLVGKILVELKDYGAKVLGLNEWKGVIYSQPLRFFGKLLNLTEERYPLVANDLSQELATRKIIFGDRVLEVSRGDQKHFAAMLSLKEYIEISTDVLDRVMQMPFEFIITQSFDFGFNLKDLEQYTHQDYLLGVSGDEYFRNISGIGNFIDSDKGGVTDYGKMQTTFMVIANSTTDLELDIKEFFEQFANLGLVVVREDIFLEHCFWSQLPANFLFLKRQKLINTSRIGGFSTLRSFSVGSSSNNHWGPAVTVLKTVLNTPYYFNFHEDDGGNSIIIGPGNSGKTVLANFLLLQSRRFGTKIFYFDYHRKSECVIKALGGQYRAVTYDQVSDGILGFNPTALRDNQENRTYLADFFITLSALGEKPVNEQEVAQLPEIISKIFSQKIATFREVIELFNNPVTANFYESLKVWNDKSLEHLFVEKVGDWDNPIQGFDFSEIAEEKIVEAALTSCLLHKIESMLDGKPTIIVMNEALDMLDNKLMASRLDAFLLRLRKKNCIMLSIISDVTQAATSDVMTILKKHNTTEIFMPNEDRSSISTLCYREVLKLNDEEQEILHIIGTGSFMIKHGADSIIASLNLDHLHELLLILSSNSDTRNAMYEAIKKAASADKPKADPETWLPLLFEELDQEKAAGRSKK